jgi:hypothetical protein
MLFHTKKLQKSAWTTRPSTQCSTLRLISNQTSVVRCNKCEASTPNGSRGSRFQAILIIIITGSTHWVWSFLVRRYYWRPRLEASEGLPWRGFTYAPEASLETLDLNDCFSIVNRLSYEGSLINTGGAPMMSLTLTRGCLTNLLKFLLICFTG